jgi:putative flippase GtrA
METESGIQSAPDSRSGNKVLKFLLVGVINTCVGLSVIYSCKWFLELGDVVSNAIGYAVGLTVSFTLNSRWTFGYRGDALFAAIRFLVVFLVAYFANLITVMALIEWAGLNSYLAQLFGVPPYTIVFYLGSKWYAFRDFSVANSSNESPGK